MKGGVIAAIVISVVIVVILAILLPILLTSSSEDTSSPGSPTDETESGLVSTLLAFPTPFPGSTVDLPITLSSVGSITGQVVNTFAVANVSAQNSVANLNVTFTQSVANSYLVSGTEVDGMFTAGALTRAGPGKWRIFFAKSLDNPTTSIETLMLEGVVGVDGSVTFDTPRVSIAVTTGISTSNVTLVAPVITVVDTVNGTSFVQTMQASDNKSEIRYFSETGPGVWTSVIADDQTSTKKDSHIALVKKNDDILMVFCQTGGLQGSRSVNNGVNWIVFSPQTANIGLDIGVVEQSDGIISFYWSQAGANKVNKLNFTDFPPGDTNEVDGFLNTPGVNLTSLQAIRVGEQVILVGGDATGGNMHVFVVAAASTLASSQQETSITLPNVDGQLVIASIAHVDGRIIVAWGGSAISTGAQSSGYTIFELSNINNAPFTTVLETFSPGSNTTYTFATLAKDLNENVGVAYFSCDSVSTSDRNILQARFLNTYNTAGYEWTAST